MYIKSSEKQEVPKTRSAYMLIYERIGELEDDEFSPIAESTRYF